MPDAIYLRKSRSDAEAEARGEGDTLARHRRALTSLAALQKRTVTHIYEEVESGDSIATRPEMQKLLAAVEQGVFGGVLVMDVDRLARGDTIDQGIVAQTFKLSCTKIITPAKTYDPNNEFDEEYFEFGLFMARREYKVINRRLQRGRQASLHEGKWPWNRAPYGYTREKLPNQKGYTLAIDPDRADTVRLIFDWYAAPDNPIGVSTICHRLNAMGIPSPTGKHWTPGGMHSILRNPAYAGWVHRGRRPVSKTVSDGKVQLSRPRAAAEDVQRYKGLHPAIISQELYDAVQAKLATHPSHPGPKQFAMQNPLAGLLYCSNCGHSMVRRPYDTGRQETILCAHAPCRVTVASDLRDVEAAIIDGLQQWLQDFALDYTTTKSQTKRSDPAAPIRTAIAAAEKELLKIADQESKAYELVEQGIYTPDTFLQRTRALAARRDELQGTLAKLTQDLQAIDRQKEARETMLPRLTRVIETYPIAKTPEEKNALLKSVLSRVDYKKTQGGRWHPSDMSLTLHPNLPD